MDGRRESSSHEATAASTPLTLRDLPARDARLVVESYERIEHRMPFVTHLFFTRLFRLQPGLRRLFPLADPASREFTATFFRFVILHLHASSQLRDLLERFGHRGMLDHVSVAEIDAIELSIVGALREVEGSAWTVATAHAWEVVYAWAWGAMRDGANARRCRSPTPSSDSSPPR